MKQTELNLRNNVYEYNNAPLDDFSFEQKNEHVERALQELGLEPCDLSHSWSNSSGLEVVPRFYPALTIGLGENYLRVDIEYKVCHDGKEVRMLMSRDSIRRLVQTYQQILGGNHVENRQG